MQFWGGQSYVLSQGSHGSLIFLKMKSYGLYARAPSFKLRPYEKLRYRASQGKYEQIHVNTLYLDLQKVFDL